MFARVLYGGRISILVGLGSALIAAIIGVGIGCYAGYKGGWVDVIAMRVSEIFMSFPQIILVLMLVSIIGQGLINLIVIFVASGWGTMFRMARAKMLSLREEEYVQALRSFGLSTARICYKHILPNALGPIMVNITLTTAMFILAEAGLSFLRPWRAAQHPDLGQHPERRPGPARAAEQLVDVAAGRPGDLAVRAQRQLHRRRVCATAPTRRNSGGDHIIDGCRGHDRTSTQRSRPEDLTSIRTGAATRR